RQAGPRHAPCAASGRAACVDAILGIPLAAPSTPLTDACMVFLRLVFAGLSGRAAAGGAGSRGAAVAVIAGRDGAPAEARDVEVAQVGRGVEPDGHVEHLVEVAVVERAVPADRD